PSVALLRRSIVFIHLWRRLQRTLGGRPSVASFSLRWFVLCYSVQRSSALFSHLSRRCSSRCFASPDVATPHRTEPVAPDLPSGLSSPRRSSPRYPCTRSVTKQACQPPLNG
ncbi:hypothetical protein HN873_047658, partial [Arachis hypogaea]